MTPISPRIFLDGSPALSGIIRGFSAASARMRLTSSGGKRWTVPAGEAPASIAEEVSDATAGVAIQSPTSIAAADLIDFTASSSNPFEGLCEYPPLDARPVRRMNE